MVLGLSMIQARRNPSRIPSILGHSPMSVLSGSMSPMIEPGDMIIIKKPKIEDIEVGDVITYSVGENTFVTHRVIGILKENKEIRFQTQGDANNTMDQTSITPENIVGIFAFRIPKGGYIASFIRRPIGIILLILLPIALLIFNELKNISSRGKRESI